MSDAAAVAGRFPPLLTEYDLRSALDPQRVPEWPVANQRLAPFTELALGIAYPGNVNPGDRRALYHLVRTLKPRSILEVGTHLGSSTIYMAEAVRRNVIEGAVFERLHTVDIIDVNDPDLGPWARLGASRSPHAAIAQLDAEGWVNFYHQDSVGFLSCTDQTFDFVFLDGSHEADVVYAELHALVARLRPGALVLLHDYFPEGRPLWPDRKVIAGPWEAVARLIAGGADLHVRPLGHLPWPTKQGTCSTSLAVLGRG